MVADKAENKLKPRLSRAQKVIQSRYLCLCKRENIQHLVELSHGGVQELLRLLPRLHIQIVIVFVQQIGVNQDKFRLAVVQRICKLPVSDRHHIAVSPEIIGCDPVVLEKLQRVYPVDHMGGAEKQHVNLIRDGKEILVSLLAFLSPCEPVNTGKQDRENGNKQNHLHRCRYHLFSVNTLIHIQNPKDAQNCE